MLTLVLALAALLAVFSLAGRWVARHLGAEPRARTVIPRAELLVAGRSVVPARPRLHLVGGGRS